MGEQAYHFTGILKTVDDEGIGSAAQLDTRIQRIFDLFSCGEGYAAGEMIRYLNHAKDALLVNHNQNFDGAARDMDGWHGTAANGFFDYLTSLKDGVQLMLDRIETLTLIITAHDALVIKMREEVNHLVDNTLRGLADAETDGCKVGASIGGAIATAVGAFAGVRRADRWEPCTA